MNKDKINAKINKIFSCIAVIIVILAMLYLVYFALTITY